ncbi:MarR family winged helix-turn-helix transcriptional regulator [Amphritea balenae]|nr:MarR family winged helix-turn-helix transcriptional regulator [Amphritea balenae]GGK75088.1 transcriptional regulator [Amphritea balenae]
MTEKKPAATAAEPQLNLSQFFPYRLSTLEMSVSQAVAQLYTGRFKMTRQEWRIMAALGSNHSMSAKEIAAHSSLEKMQVSRAISGLKKAELINQQEDPDDRRYTKLSLTDKGLNIYRQIVPLALAREAFILSDLSDEEQQQLFFLMDKVQNKAKELQQCG